MPFLTAEAFWSNFYGHHWPGIRADMLRKMAPLPWADLSALDKPPPAQECDAENDDDDLLDELLGLETEPPPKELPRVEQSRPGPGHAPTGPQIFRNPRARRMWVRCRQLDGRSPKEIAVELGVTPQRICQILRHFERDQRSRRMVLFGHLSRPLDMGGPRDVWLTYLPSPDPRLDNPAPVGRDSP